MNEMTLQSMKTMAEIFARSRLVTQTDPGDLFVLMQTGVELGMTPMASIRSIHVIKGRPTLSADLMHALVRRSGLCKSWRYLDYSETRCVIECARTGDTEPTVIEFNADDARRAGLSGGNWAKYPRDMMRARAVARACRALWPDVCAGLYTPEELGGDAGIVIDATPKPEQTAQAKQIEQEPRPSVDAFLAAAEPMLSAMDVEPGEFIAWLQREGKSIEDAPRILSWLERQAEREPSALKGLING